MIFFFFFELKVLSFLNTQLFLKMSLGFSGETQEKTSFKALFFESFSKNQCLGSCVAVDVCLSVRDKCFILM